MTWSHSCPQDSSIQWQGPLLMCTFFCLSLNHDAGRDGHIGPHFAEIFILIWTGFYFVGVNYKLLATGITGRKTSLMAAPSIFQLVCVLGYCLSGPCIAIIILKIVESTFYLEMKSLLYEKLLIGLLLGFCWPTLSAVRILSKYQMKEKRMLAIYPIGLLYFIISWFIISAHWW